MVLNHNAYGVTPNFQSLHKDQATQLLKQLEQSSLDTPDVWLNRAFCYKALEDMPHALACFLRAIPGSYPSEFMVIQKQMHQLIQTHAISGLSIWWIWGKYIVDVIPWIMVQLIFIMLLLWFCWCIVMQSYIQLRSMRLHMGVLGISLFVMVIKYRLEQQMYGIITEDTQLMIGPDDRMGVRETMHAGTHIKIINNQGAWVLAQYGNHKGWLKRIYLEII